MDRIEPLLSELQKDISLARLYIDIERPKNSSFFPAQCPFECLAGDSGTALPCQPAGSAPEALV